MKFSKDSIIMVHNGKVIMIKSIKKSCVFGVEYLLACYDEENLMRKKCALFDYKPGELKIAVPLLHTSSGQ